jgi:hypothetical protein
MALTIHLTDSLATRLKTRAALQRLPPEQLALDILSSALESRHNSTKTLDDVVAAIRATPPGVPRPATGSLQDALGVSESLSDFDLDLWEADWVAVEQEMEAVSWANALSEGLD